MGRGAEGVDGERAEEMRWRSPAEGTLTWPEEDGGDAGGKGGDSGGGVVGSTEGLDASAMCWVGGGEEGGRLEVAVESEEEDEEEEEEEEGEGIEENERVVCTG